MDSITSMIVVLQVSYWLKAWRVPGWELTFKVICALCTIFIDVSAGNIVEIGAVRLISRLHFTKLLLISHFSFSMMFVWCWSWSFSLKSLVNGCACILVIWKTPLSTSISALLFGPLSRSIISMMHVFKWVKVRIICDAQNDMGYDSWIQVDRSSRRSIALSERLSGDNN